MDGPAAAPGNQKDHDTLWTSKRQEVGRIDTADMEAPSADLDETDSLMQRRHIKELRFDSIIRQRAFSFAAGVRDGSRGTIRFSLQDEDPPIRVRVTCGPLFEAGERHLLLEQHFFRYQSSFELVLLQIFRERAGRWDEVLTTDIDEWNFVRDTIGDLNGDGFSDFALRYEYRFGPG